MVTFAPLTLRYPASENPYEPADYYTSDTETRGVRQPLLVVVSSTSRHAAPGGTDGPSPELTGLVARLLSTALPHVQDEVRIGPASSRLDAPPARVAAGRYVAA
jgi:hypothetical protein